MNRIVIDIIVLIDTSSVMISKANRIPSISEILREALSDCHGFEPKFSLITYDNVPQKRCLNVPFDELSDILNSNLDCRGGMSNCYTCMSFVSDHFLRENSHAPIIILASACHPTDSYYNIRKDQLKLFDSVQIIMLRDDNTMSMNIGNSVSINIQDNDCSSKLAERLRSIITKYPKVSDEEYPITDINKSNSKTKTNPPNKRSNA